MTDETDGTNEAEPTVPSSLVIDLVEVRDAEALQRLLPRSLMFPDFYGRNWNAFWDAITGLVDLPHELTFTGWTAFSANLPTEARNLRELLDRYLST
ncbi:barstar family protein [Streptomyces pseudogriseolus]|uniref:barstar family protein n=1 Tax=Streptomyces TaxID=1883 RepID=UPI00068A0442|nr:barstar family protein [Streptomyces sp. NRRL F-5527]